MIQVSGEALIWPHWEVRFHSCFPESIPHTGNNSCYTSKFINTIYVHCNNTLCWEYRRINL